MVKARVPSLEEYIDEVLQASNKATKVDVLKTAMKFYNTVELWCLYAEVTDDFGNGFYAVRHDIAKSHIYWNRFYSSKVTVEEFLSRLAEPHLEVDETMALFRQLHGDEHVDKARENVSECKRRLGRRVDWELKVINPTVDTWLDYIHWEQDSQFKLALFNRAVAVFPNEPRIWHRFIQFTWDDPCASHVQTRAATLCPHPSIETTMALLGEGSATSKESKLAELCFLLSKAYTDTESAEEFKSLATKYIKHSRDAEFIGYVQSMLLVIDKPLAESLWVLKNDEMYKEWFNWQRLALMPDITAYFVPILDLQETNLAILQEKLRAYLVLGMSLKVDTTLMEIRELPQPQQAKEEPPNDPARNRENTTIVIVGPITKDQLYAAIGPSHIVSSQQFPNYHLVEMTSPQTKKVALATLMFSKKLQGIEKCYDAADTTLWVTNYNPLWGKQELENAFSKYGTVLAVRLPNTSGRRFCYIQMSTAQEAVDALSRIGTEYPELVVKISDPNARNARSGAVEEKRQVYVSGLDFETPRPQLVAWISSHSIFPPKSVQVPNSKRGREHDGYAFVEYPSSEQANEACSYFNTLDHAGRPVRANISHKKRRQENPNVLVLENVWDLDGLKQLVDGEVSYDEAKKVAHVYFDSQSQVGRAMLKAQGQELAGHTLRVRSDLKPRGLQ